MAYSRLKQTKDGLAYYEIRVSDGGTRRYERWYVPAGWSKRAVEQGLNRAIRNFENRVAAGEVTSRKERRAIAEAERRKADRIVTIRQYAERVFLPRKKIETAPSTYSYYKFMLNAHVLPRYGDMKIAEITSVMLAAYMLELAESDLSMSTCIGIYTALHQIFKHAYTDDIIQANPMDKVSRPKRKKAKALTDEVEAYTEEELIFILTCAENEPIKWQTLIHLMANTGIRRGEVCGLKWADIDFDRAEITISENRVYIAGEGVISGSPKNGKARTIPLDYGSMALLKKLDAEQKEDTERRKQRLIKEHRPLEIAKIAQAEYVFTERGYITPMNPQTPTAYFRKFGKKYGIDHFHPHKLRHTFASVAITNGADIVSVSQILGHSDVSITLQTYSHANKESMKRAAEVFRNAISKQA